MKKKHFIWIIVFVLFAAVGVMSVYKLDAVYRILSQVRNSISSSIESRHMHEEKVSLAEYEPLENEPGAWYTKYHFIAHSGGAVDGRCYTNSVQAWELSYANGNRVFDADMAFTTDNILVLRHDWNDNLEQGIIMKESHSYTDANGMPRQIVSQEQMDYAAFKSTKMYYKYDAMSCEDMLNYMASHEDIYVACDMKDDVIVSYQYLVDKAVEMGVQDVLNRIIVNLYDYDLYDSIMDIFHFKNVTMRQFFSSPNNYYELIAFCVTHDIHVVNVSSCYMKDEGIQLLKNYGIHVIVAVVDYISDMHSYYELGADGAVTNFLYESDWAYVEK